MDSHFGRVAATPRLLVFSIDQDQRLTYVSANVRPALGYEPADLVGVCFLDRLHPDDHDRARELWAQLRAGRMVRRVQLRVPTSEGHYVPFVMNVLPRTGEGGEFVGVAGIGHEVRATSDAGAEHVRLLGEIGGLRLVGESLTQPRDLPRVLEDITRYPVSLGAEACWVGLFEEGTLRLRPVAHRGPMAAALAKAAERCAADDSNGQTLLERAIVTREIVVEDLERPGAPRSPCTDEARRHGCRSMAVVPMAYGEQALGAICVCSRQPGFFEAWKLELLGLFAQSAAAAVANTQALERARQSEARFHDLVERLPCVAFVAKPGRPPEFVYVTSTIERFSGYSPDDFYADGEVAFRCVHPDDCERVRSIVREATHRAEPYTIEYRMVHRKTGAIRHVSLRSAPQSDTAGNVVLRQGVILDVTEQKGLEHELRQSQRLAAIGEMAAMMAHEIRNPLAGMSLALRMLGTAEDDDEMRQECVGDLDGCLQRINATVSRVLDFAKARPLDLRSCRLPDILDAARALTATYIRRSNIGLDADLPPDLPQIVADPDQLEQVYVNLILNACKAMPNGGRVAIRARANAHTLCTEVTDTGIGIEPKDMDHIFDTFYSGFGDGTGLGLPLCRRIIAAHGGTIDVQSTPGKGSTFRIELPLEPQDASSADH